MAAAAAVLGNDALVETILGFLGTPRLCCPPRYGHLGALSLPIPQDYLKTRWPAAWACRVFRRAALNLPWDVFWVHRRGPSQPYVTCLATWLRGRTLHLSIDCPADRLPASADAEARLLLSSAGPRLQRLVALCEPRAFDLVVQCRQLTRLQLAGWLPEQLAQASQLTQLREVDFGQVTDVAWLSSLPHLSRLSLSPLQHPGSGALPVCHLPALRALELRYCERTSLEAWAAPGLTQLDALYATLGPAPGRALGGVPCFASLQRLRLSCCPVLYGAEELEAAFCALTSLTIQTSLNSLNPPDHAQAFFAPPRLQQLDLSLSIFRVESVQAKLLGLQRLRRLTLRLSRCGEEPVRPQAEALVASLTALGALTQVEVHLADPFARDFGNFVETPSFTQSLDALGLAVASRGGELTVVPAPDVR